MKNVLFLTGDAPFHATDLLYNGFSKLPEVTVWDYPIKATYHGGKIENKHTGLKFDTPMPVFHINGVGQELKDGKYDFAIVDTRSDTAWMNIAKRYVPVVLMDGEDTKALPSKEYLDRSDIILKREYLKVDHDNIANIISLPLSFPTTNEPHSEKERDIAVSFVCCATSNLRVKMHEWLSQFKNIPQIVSEVFYHPYSPKTYEQYIDILDRSVIAISLPGNGFDTFRHWEIPAHGAGLFSLILPIEIPNPFINRKEAIYGDNIKELIELIVYYFRNINETKELATAGRKALYERHLSIHRAQKVLEVVDQFKKTGKVK